MQVCDTAGQFDLIPLLDALERQFNHLNGRNVLVQHVTEEEKEVNEVVYTQTIFILIKRLL